VKYRIQFCSPDGSRDWSLAYVNDRWGKGVEAAYRRAQTSMRNNGFHREGSFAEIEVQRVARDGTGYWELHSIMAIGPSVNGYHSVEILS
jgi:hypothetical protein